MKHIVTTTLRYRIYTADRMGATGTRGRKDLWRKQEANSELCIPSEVINIVPVLVLEFPVNLAGVEIFAAWVQRR